MDSTKKKMIAKVGALVGSILIVIAMICVSMCRDDVVAEVCDNMLDDSGNGLVDCADEACATWPGCLPHGMDDDSGSR